MCGSLSSHSLKTESNFSLDALTSVEQAKGLLEKWKHIFSSGPTDLDFTDLVEHEIS